MKLKKRKPLEDMLLMIDFRCKDIHKLSGTAPTIVMKEPFSETEINALSEKCLKECYSVAKQSKREGTTTHFALKYCWVAVTHALETPKFLKPYQVKLIKRTSITKKAMMAVPVGIGKGLKK